jgi:hypothetical protein
MTPRQPDELELLSAVNPVLVREPDDDERAQANAMLERIFDEPGAEPSVPSPRRRTRRSWRMALAGGAAVALATVAALFVAFPRGKDADAVAQVLAALNAREGVFRVVAQTTIVKAGGVRTRTWTQAWASADGRRSRSLVYDAAPDGSRGRLIGEGVGDSMRNWADPRDGGSIPADDDRELALRPRSFVLALLRSGRVTSRTTVTIAGRKAWRFEVSDRVGSSYDTVDARHGRRPAHTRHIVLIVDRSTHLPLLLRITGLASWQTKPGGPLTFPKLTTTTRFTVFEHLTQSAGAARLRPRYQRRSG